MFKRKGTHKDPDEAAMFEVKEMEIAIAWPLQVMYCYVAPSVNNSPVRRPI